MKKQLPAFFTGFLAAVLVLSLSLSAFATITGKTTIEVGPISIMVNGEVFQPTDVNGNPVDVFVYKGTTYAPLRALAEAYGLEVSYDGEAKMAVVKEPEPVEPEKPAISDDYSKWDTELEAKYQEFTKLWSFQPMTTSDGKSGNIWLYYAGKATKQEFFNSEKENETMYKEFYKRFAAEICSEKNMDSLMVQFFVGDTFTVSIAVDFKAVYHDSIEVRSFYIP